MQHSLKKLNLSGKSIHFVVLSGIIILTLIIYSGSLKNGFLNWDDNILVTGNKDIQDFSISGIVKIFTSLYQHAYNPLRILSYSITYHFFGLNPPAFHSINIFFHLLNIILVYLFIYQLTSLQTTDHSPQTSRNRIQVSALVACLFAVHPMHTESVCWISALCDPQYSFYYLASLIFYLKYLQQSTENNQKSKIYFNKNYLISLFLFVLSLLSKSMAVTLPVILILLDYYSGRKFNFKSIIDKAPFIILGVFSGIITIITEKLIHNNNDVTIEYSLINRLFSVTYSIYFYIIYVLFPLKLSAIHTSPEISGGFLPVKYYLSPLLIILIIVIILKTKNTRRELIFGTLFFLITISVTLIAGKVRYAEVAERYTYIPYIGLFFIIAIFASPQSTVHSPQKKCKMQNIKVLIIIFIILCFSFITYNRNKVWENSLNIYNDVLLSYPRDFMALNNRGNTKHSLGDNQGAIEDYTKALDINPKYSEAFYNRGNAKSSLGDLYGAIKDYDKAIEIKPLYPDAFLNRGNAKSFLGDMHGAISDFNKTIEINPYEARAFIARGNAKYALGDKQGAIEDYNKAKEINPMFAKAFYEKGSPKYFLRGQ
jgi:protein O-mannosyl-transferase